MEINKYKTVNLYDRGEGVVCIELNRPDNLNAFDSQLVEDLGQALNDYCWDRETKSVILTGAGKGFCSGADLASRKSKFKTTQQALLNGYKGIIDNIINCPIPVVAAVNGPAAGIGSALVLASDFVLMNKNAFISLVFSNISLVPDGGASWLLANAIGYQRALKAAIMAERLTAQICLEYGIAMSTTEAEDLMPSAEKWAKQLASRAPLSMKYTKALMRMSSSSTFDQVYQKEAEIQNELMRSDDHKEGVKAFFEKRKPNFSGK